MTGVLAGKVALVTGAARGIGEAIARLYHAEGARVAVADVNEAGGEALAGALGERALFQHLDVTDEAAWKAAIATVVARWGRLDALVNNAGIIARKSLLETSVADMEAHFRVNQLGVFLGMKAAAPALQAAGGGAIVNLSSSAGLVARPNVFAYSATKWAVRGMSKAAAAELGPLNIRVNSIHPGIIETEMTKAYGEAGIKAAVAAIPLRRSGQVEDVARLALYLASDASAYSTGCEFVVDGGLTVI
jgi:3alpha(or 20beta)-hydroxysteroid dehydrogenase